MRIGSVARWYLRTLRTAYVVDTRTESGCVFAGPRFVARWVARRMGGHFDTAPHVGGCCPVGRECAACVVAVDAVRAER